MPDAGGRGTDCGRICGDMARAFCGPVGLTFEPGPRVAPIPGRVAIVAEPRPVIPPAFGGRGTERAPTALGTRIEPGFGDDENPPCGERLLPMELRAPFPGIEVPRFTPIWGEPVLPRPIEGVLRIPAMPLRFVAGGVMWLTTGRAKLRAGAAPRDVPPAIVVRVGRTSGERTADSDVRLSWFWETRTEFRETDSEFTSVLREAAVNPFGARMLA